MILLNKQKHPLLYDWVEKHYAEIGKRYQQINKDKTIFGSKVWVYFKDESYEKIKKEIGIKENYCNMKFDSNTGFFVVASHAQYLEDKEKSKYARKNAHISEDEKLYTI